MPDTASIKRWLRRAFVAAPPPDSTPHPTGPLSFFRKHLRGDYPLVRAYWLHLQLGIYLFMQGQDALAILLSDQLAARHASLLSLVLRLLAYPFWIFLVIGAWASARRHAGRGGLRPWALAAQLAILVNVGLQVWFTPQAVPELRGLWTVATGFQPGQAPVFLLSRDTRSLMLHGGLHDGTAAALEQVLSRAPQVRTIVLNSDGGWMREARLVGDLIAAHRLNTHVQWRCTGACTLPFLAGQARSVAQGAQLGFDSFDRRVPELGRFMMRRAYARYGADKDFIDKFAAKRRDATWYPDASDMIRYRLVTPMRSDALPQLDGPFITMKP